MPQLLIVESNTPELIAARRKTGKPTAAELYGAALQASGTGVAFDICTPYDDDFKLDQIDFAAYDGLVFTGSGVQWCVDAPEAQPLRDTMEAALKAEKPILGSCNGMQLGNVVLGGRCGAASTGMELGLARDIRLTDAGKAHAFHQGRQDHYAVLCVHRDQVTQIPEGAVVTAGNAHSQVQGMVYEQGNTRFWGIQYHPELTLENMIDAVATPGSLFAEGKTLLSDLQQAKANPQGEAARRLGAQRDDLDPTVHRTELRNWLKTL